MRRPFCTNACYAPNRIALCFNITTEFAMPFASVSEQCLPEIATCLISDIHTFIQFKLNFIKVGYHLPVTVLSSTVEVYRLLIANHIAAAQFIKSCRYRASTLGNVHIIRMGENSALCDFKHGMVVLINQAFFFFFSQQVFFFVQ